MKQYFSIDSTIFTIISIGLIIIWSSGWLLFWSILTVIFIISKDGNSKGQIEDGIWTLLGLLFVFWVWFWLVVSLIILFLFWFAIFYSEFIA